MTKEEIEKTLEENMQAVPLARIVNNHMGSRFTQERQAIIEFLSYLKEKNFVFIDSLTSSKSVAFKIANELGMLSLKRDVFLDHNKDKEAITKQLHRLISLAQKRGIALGIGHPYQSTLDVLKENQLLLKEEVELIGIEEFVEHHTKNSPQDTSNSSLE